MTPYTTKRMFLLLAALLFCGIAPSRGQAPSVLQPASAEAKIPEYFYCEIIGNHLPTYRGDGVLFDFGQKTEAWAYNWLTDTEGRKLVFGSGVEALNYMVSRGWEFVQAYTSGDENRSTHFLLRIATSKLTDDEQKVMLTPPKSQPEVKKNKKK